MRFTQNETETGGPAVAVRSSPRRVQKQRTEQRAASVIAEARPNVAIANTPPTRREPTVDDIRHRAHDIYLTRNGAPGNEVLDWLIAELELRAEFRRQHGG